jgi:glycosyltransferase involved in cell wall biosynthesis
MQISTPKVTVAIASYNHEKFIDECLQSVLKQTFQDFEIIITDDGSSDTTVSRISTINDKRVQLERFSQNKGACIAINNSIRKAKGQYVAILNSDDAWAPLKLQKQVDFLDHNPNIGAVFSRTTFIDEHSKEMLSTNTPYFFVFDQENRSRFEWLSYFFSHGNSICHPSILIRRECYEKVGLYNECMANLPDLDMWVRLCLQYEIHILHDKLVRFRIRHGEVNASGNTLPNQIRTRFEYKQILNHYLLIKETNDFLAIFPEASKYGKVSVNTIPYFLARLALDVNNNTWQLWGLELLYKLLENKEMSKNIEDQFGFSYRDFYKLTAKFDTFSVSPIISSYPIFSIFGIGLSINPKSKIGKFAVNSRRLLLRVKGK